MLSLKNVGFLSPVSSSQSFFVISFSSFSMGENKLYLNV